ncbi:THUMP domain-containing protein 1 homolog [Drosophila pseudoobscura]|uniref:THUMP domain-containing protein 1 homolog n=1 Tax=Drosophila pseudoobscura pseudoobscura TaxID=46245 RepID=Q2LZ85_DROPS|nr:THUMP domain-containing protein 1 homolog [Drosophila pseudoobscura]
MEPANKKSKMTSHSKFHQKNKKKYFQSNKQVLQVGQRGFFATCNINEKGCVRECYNLLNHYADILYGPEQPKETEKKQSAGETGKGSGSTNDDDDDLEAAAAKCRETLTQRKVRFQNVETGTTNCIFIRTLLDDPVGLGKHIVDDITTTGKSMSRFVLRLVPIEAVCRANMPDIIAAAGPLFDKHFLKEPTSYGIIFNHRYNQQIKRDQIILDLADLVNSKNAGNKVDLKQAKKSIIVEVLRGWCLLSVIDNYLESKKYNLVELANPSEKKSNGDAETKAEEKSVEEAKPNDEDAAEESDKDRPTDETDKASAASPAVQNE